MLNQCRCMYSKELTERLDRIIAQQKADKKVEELQGKIGGTCQRMYKELTKMVGSTKVALRAGRLVPILLTLPGTRVYAAVSGNADTLAKIRQAFEQLMEIATAIAEPILWFYALTSLILMATGKSKTIGWNRLKNVGYAYIGMTLLPTIFAFLRWISSLLRTAFTLV